MQLFKNYLNFSAPQQRKMYKCISLFFLGQAVNEIFKCEIFLEFFSNFIAVVADFFFPDNYRAVIKLRKRQHIVVSESDSLTDFIGDCNPSFFSENSVNFKHYSSSLSASSALHSSQIQSQQHSLQSSSHLSIRITPSKAEICTAQSDVIPDTIRASNGMLT